MHDSVAVSESVQFWGVKKDLVALPLKSQLFLTVHQRARLSLLVVSLPSYNDATRRRYVLTGQYTALAEHKGQLRPRVVS